MSKKNRTPSWLKTFKKPKGRKVQTEVFTIPGMGTITKAGRFVQLDSHRTPAEQAALMQRLAATHDGVVARIQASVDACAAIVPNHDPLDLMHRAYTAFVHGMLGIESEHEVGHEQSIDMRTLEYLPSPIRSAVGDPWGQDICGGEQAV